MTVADTLTSPIDIGQIVKDAVVRHQKSATEARHEELVGDLTAILSSTGAGVEKSAADDSLKGPPHEPASKDEPGEGGRFKALTQKLQKKAEVDQLVEHLADLALEKYSRHIKAATAISLIKLIKSGQIRNPRKFLAVVRHDKKAAIERLRTSIRKLGSLASTHHDLMDRVLEKMGAKIRDPKAVAASIGREKYGKKQFQQMAASGRKKEASAPPNMKAVIARLEKAHPGLQKNAASLALLARIGEALAPYLGRGAGALGRGMEAIPGVRRGAEAVGRVGERLRGLPGASKGVERAQEFATNPALKAKLEEAALSEVTRREGARRLAQQLGGGALTAGGTGAYSLTT